MKLVQHLTGYLPVSLARLHRALVRARSISRLSGHHSVAVSTLPQIGGLGELLVKAATGGLVYCIFATLLDAAGARRMLSSVSSVRKNRS